MPTLHQERPDECTMIQPLCHYAWGFFSQASATQRRNLTLWNGGAGGGDDGPWSTWKWCFKYTLKGLDLQIKGMLIKKMCVCVYAVLCADSSVVDPEVVKSLTPEKHVQCIQIKEKHGETRTFWREKPCRHPSMSTMQSVTIPHWLNTKEDGYHFMHLELQGSAQPSVWWGKSDGMPQLSTIPINAIKNSLNPKINPKTKLKNPNHPTIPMPKPFLVRLSAANGKASARCWHDLDGNELLPLWLRGKTHQ